mmetsp:Transcript_133499/g.386443  ORF Transcript_133499/g.386443 Transcript_133499/m.386443 type:complete len:224 (+) Transcript_133499:677-1348(+)
MVPGGVLEGLRLELPQALAQELAEVLLFAAQLALQVATPLLHSVGFGLELLASPREPLQLSALRRAEAPQGVARHLRLHRANGLVASGLATRGLLQALPAPLEGDLVSREVGFAFLLLLGGPHQPRLLLPALVLQLAALTVQLLKLLGLLLSLGVDPIQLWDDVALERGARLADLRRMTQPHEARGVLVAAGHRPVAIDLVAVQGDGVQVVVLAGHLVAQLQR